MTASHPGRAHTGPGGSPAPLTTLRPREAPVTDWQPPGDDDAPPPDNAPPPPPPDLRDYRRSRDVSRSDDVPRDDAAERSVIGSVLLSSAALEDVSQRLQPSDFYRPAHELIYDVAVGLYARRVPVDTITVADELARRESLTRAGGHAYLHELIAGVPTAANAGYYAQIVAEKATLRHLVSAGARIAELGRSHAGADSLVATFDAARQVLDLAAGSTAIAGVPGVDRPVDGIRVDDFLAADESDEPEWLVPGFLERRDRIIVTAAEGAGKSTLLRQWAVQIAAGLHPFTTREIPAQRVILLDLENSERQVRRKLRPLVHQVARIIDPGNLIIACKADGLNLGDPADRTWIDRLIGHHRPDIVIGGPLYKLAGGNPNDEVDVKPAALFLDAIRARHDVALALEAHTRKGENSQAKTRPKEPFGWSGWMRWPEFGIHLDKDGKITHWRGMREVDREIPENLHRGGIWPWMPVFENSRLAMFIRLEECVEAAGEMLSQREVARRTGISEPLVRRLIAEHGHRWDALNNRVRGA